MKINEQDFSERCMGGFDDSLWRIVTFVLLQNYMVCVCVGDAEICCS